jgi:hypothetical protein
MLLTIPVELREIIFKQLFGSITVRHGFGSTSSTHTSILRTCRQLHSEAKPLMAPNISLNFKNTEAMVDCLTTLSAVDIQNIRNIRLKGFPVPLYAKKGAGYYMTYAMSFTLPMFPGLKLDCLTVEDCFHDEGVNGGWGDCGTYFDIESLLKSDGWKELHFISPATEFMSSQNDHNNARVAQPAGWNELLKSRDGEHSGAGVKMYFANGPKVAGLAEMPQTRTPWDAVPGQLPPGALMADMGSLDADAREILVVAKRGKDASYVQDGSDLDEDIKSLLSSMSWAEIKEKKYIPPYDDPCAHL